MAGNRDTNHLWGGSRGALKLPNHKVVLWHLLLVLLQDTSFPQYVHYLIGDGMNHVGSLVLDALTPSSNKLYEGPGSCNIAM